MANAACCCMYVSAQRLVCTRTINNGKNIGRGKQKLGKGQFLFAYALRMRVVAGDENIFAFRHPLSDAAAGVDCMMAIPPRVTEGSTPFKNSPFYLSGPK
jgi:hypothetical protein